MSTFLVGWTGPTRAGATPRYRLDEVFSRGFGTSWDSTSVPSSLGVQVSVTSLRLSKGPFSSFSTSDCLFRLTSGTLEVNQETTYWSRLHDDPLIPRPSPIFVLLIHLSFNHFILCSGKLEVRSTRGIEGFKEVLTRRSRNLKTPTKTTRGNKMARPRPSGGDRP